MAIRANHGVVVPPEHVEHVDLLVLLHIARVFEPGSEEKADAHPSEPKERPHPMGISNVWKQ